MEARRAKKVDPQPCHLVWLHDAAQRTKSQPDSRLQVFLRSDDSSDSDDGSVVSDMTSGTERSPMMGRQMLPAAP